MNCYGIPVERLRHLYLDGAITLSTDNGYRTYKVLYKLLKEELSEK